MRKVSLAMNISLDGYSSGPNGEMDWIVPFSPETWRDISKILSGVDTFLLGRVTFLEWAYFWPNVITNPASSTEDAAFARLAESYDKIVFSRTLKSVEYANSRISSDPAAEISRLKAQPGKDITVSGGASLASSLIQLNLIDEYSFIVTPVVLGGGKSPFQNDPGRKNLILLDTKTYPGGTVSLTYQTRN